MLSPELIEKALLEQPILAAMEFVRDPSSGRVVNFNPYVGGWQIAFYTTFGTAPVRMPEPTAPPDAPPWEPPAIPIGAPDCVIEPFRQGYGFMLPLGADLEGMYYWLSHVRLQMDRMIMNAIDAALATQGGKEGQQLWWWRRYPRGGQWVKECPYSR